ncbi:hypothetical protein EXIGLDRAFT_823647 [Exidia glandulosa HHB12029]|uniref:Uncharacterized protein n=1 Tax=Exidia glandulosa HHB12029 TaxID=1314781 RepID=A0A165J824_EXIGL|nr:hypothetical protein EXIGLDRAFT_823647 [Exidia glandulosa HHB12029]
MATYKLEVLVTGQWVQRMKEMNFKLCVAKKVNGKFTVVWASKKHWEDAYEIGTIEKFAPGELLQQARAKTQPIAFGQTVVRKKDGTLSEATGQPHGASFELVNEGAKTFVVLDQQIGNEFSTIWADPDGMVNGVMELTPHPKVMVFFEKTMETGTMFIKVKNPSIEVDFTGHTERTVSFVEDAETPGVGIWVQGAVKGLGNAVQMSYSVEDGFKPLAGGHTLTGDEAGDRLSHAYGHSWVDTFCFTKKVNNSYTGVSEAFGADRHLATHGAKVTVDNQGDETKLSVDQKIDSKFQFVWADHDGTFSSTVDLTPRPPMFAEVLSPAHGVNFIGGNRVEGESGHWHLGGGGGGGAGWTPWTLEWTVLNASDPPCTSSRVPSTDPESSTL